VRVLPECPTDNDDGAWIEYGSLVGVPVER
jgi:hypothetical protein